MSDLQYSPFFYVSIGICFSGAVGALVYAFNIYFSDELSDESNDSLEKSAAIKHKLTVPTAIKLMSKINRQTESIFAEKIPDSEIMRKKHFYNLDKYKDVVKHLFEVKNEAFIFSKNDIYKEYGIKYEDIVKILDPVCPIKIEKKLIQYSEPDLCGAVPDKEIVRAAFEFYGRRCIEEMRKFIESQEQINNSQDKENKEMEQLVSKFRIEDELTLKFNISESQMKYFLFKFNLDKEKKVYQIFQEISKFEEKLC
jgi:uncharacterized membrane protein required for colicin V production